MALEPGKVTICIVNYKTEDLTKLCLRSIRKYTRYPYEVIVVDNDSGDSSLDYLRTVPWIRLFERPGEIVKPGSPAHGTGLDRGLKCCNTEYFMTIHSDTFVHRKDWLIKLIEIIEQSPMIACIGGGKLDLKSKWQLLLKQATDVRKWIRNINNNKRDDFYIRTICGLYRTEVLKKEKLTFAMKTDDGMTCGKQLYYELIDRGYKTQPISPWKMSKYIHHLAHATMVLNPEFKVRKRTARKCRESLSNILNSPIIQEILKDDSLDH